MSDEIYKIMVAFSSHNFNSTAELTQLIITTIFAKIDQPNCETLFECANDYMIQLGLDSDCQHVDLYPNKFQQKKQTRDAEFDIKSKS